jgi:glycosyltransferase involved in cell wall biosynthesis/SAM-dependent methyltransferase/uncharacterized protein YbaR (Trm112 family)
MSVSMTARTTGLSPLVGLLTCLECQAPIELAEIAEKSGYPELGPDGWLECTSCGERYPVIGGTPRMIGRDGRQHLADQYPAAAINLGPAERDGRPQPTTSELTAESFAYEWTHFGKLRAEWRKNFLDYMRPHPAEFFRDKLLLDVGAGSGRHSAQAAALGAEVVAIDLGRSIDVSRRNLPQAVLTVQADAERLPFAPESFDFVMSIGVLHHLPDTQAALKWLVPFVKPGGWLHVYLYWVPRLSWHRAVLRLVAAVRRVTVRMPFWLLRQLCYPLSAMLWVGVVLPYRALRAYPQTAGLARLLPLKTYADYPFTVLVNDQFDRFSAPIEQRFSRAQVQVMLERAGLEQVTTLPNHGWVGDGRRDHEVERSVSAGISVVVTVLNDRADLRELLRGLASQTERPDEIVFVDGGSVDGTRDELETFELPGSSIRTIVAPGANIAAGRNIGVRAARNELIACTDAGCRPDPDWLAALRRDLQEADIVGGVFVADGQTEFERIVSLTHYPVPEELEEPDLFVRISHRLFGRRYLANRAGGRSMAFHRDIWRAVGGFPERQYAGEDQAFARSTVDHGFTPRLAREAVVHWRPPATWGANARMFYLYCRGDVRSKGRLKHVVRLVAWSGSPIALARGGTRSRAGLAISALAYTALPLRRAQLAGIKPTSWWRIPVAVAVKDLAQIVGAAHGTIDAVRGIPQPTPGGGTPSAQNAPSE